MPPSEELGSLCVAANRSVLKAGLFATLDPCRGDWLVLRDELSYETL
jgi:hypothetical protein